MIETTLTQFGGGTSRELHRREATAETGCACPICRRNIAHTHGERLIATTYIADDHLREMIATPAVRVNGWHCESCKNVVVVRDMEEGNTCWSQMSNSDERYVAVALIRSDGSLVLGAVDRNDISDLFTTEFGKYCSWCGCEYGGSVTEARIPCRPCRGGEQYYSWTKSRDDEVRLHPNAISTDWIVKRPEFGPTLSTHI